MDLAEPVWIYVEGGTLRFGDHSRHRTIPDLWWSKTPVTWLQADQTKSDVAGDLPCTGLNLAEAEALAVRLGARLPTSAEWEWAASGREERPYPWGGQTWDRTRANLYPTGIGRAKPAGYFPAGSTPEGLLDLAGNVWEWTSTPVPLDGAIVRGGSYNSNPLHAKSKFLNAAPRELRSPGIGLRLVRDRA